MANKKNENTTEQKQTQAEEALGGKPVGGSNAGTVDTTGLSDIPAPPGFEEAGQGFSGNTVPERFDVRLASRDEIMKALGRPWAQVTRINQGKALVRLAVYDGDVLIAVVTGRYAISNDGRVTGPFFFQDDSWPQYQAGHNNVLDRLGRVASSDGDQGAYFRELCQRAGVSPFASDNNAGRFITVGGVLARDAQAFCNAHAEWLGRRILGLSPPQRRQLATTAPPAPQA